MASVSFKMNLYLETQMCVYYTINCVLISTHDKQVCKSEYEQRERENEVDLLKRMHAPEKTLQVFFGFIFLLFFPWVDMNGQI